MMQTCVANVLNVCSIVAKVLSLPPGEYDRKIKTQRNRRGPAQAVEYVVQFDDERGTLPGFDMLLQAPRNRGRLRGC